MAQSLSKMLVHLIFSTKDRGQMITDDIRDELHAYLVGIFKAYQSPSIIINSVADHVHVLFILSKNHALADIIEEVKKSSSKWVKTKGYQYASFAWQGGYGAFSVSESDCEAVKQYIAKQQEHHREVTFQEELRALLDRNGIAYDERYIWV